MEQQGFPTVAPEGFCARFERCATSLIEEPEYCEVCVFYCERDATAQRAMDSSCRWPEPAQE